MYYEEEKTTDKYGLTGSERIQEFIALCIVFLMLAGCFAKVVFL